MKPANGVLPWYARLHDLMPNRIREILLVSSHYDAFILEEDGPLTERIFATYSEMNLSWAPRITHVARAAQARILLESRRFDLVILMPRIEDAEVSAVARELKAFDPTLPVVLLLFSEADLQHLPGGAAGPEFDHVFVWSGDARILITINKLVEDLLNLEFDTLVAGVPAIIFVEDSVRYASAFLTELYTELMVQSQSLVAEGLNNLHKLLRMRTRPKVVHVDSYEAAVAAYDRIGERTFALISDLGFYRDGKVTSDAGLALVSALRERRRDLPVLMQSADDQVVERVRAVGLPCIHKRSPTLLRELRGFMLESLGFGDFVFRLPDRTELARARDTFEMEWILRDVAAESLIFHATQNHFNTWFNARGLFDVAATVRPKTVADFGGAEGLRRGLIDLLRQAHEREQEGMIADFRNQLLRPGSVFVRVGEGSIGGKARGIAFANSVAVREQLGDRHAGLRVAVPRTVVIGTAEFDEYMARNRLHEELPRLTDDLALRQRFLEATLSEQLRHDLRVLWRDWRGPLAVRSSSLLEDLQFQPFSGVYATYMLPNNHPDPEVRFAELCRAVKAVYASTFCENARAYVAGTSHRLEEEKMAVVVQQIVGAEHHGRFYPHFSGVALSYNFYPVQGQQPEDGTALVALGLGQLIVQGGAALRFSPVSPNVLPQFKRAADYLRLTQKSFFGLDLTKPMVDFLEAPESSLALYDLEAAEEDGTLGPVGSVYSAADDAIRENLSLPGPRVVTFNNVLKWGSVPLGPVLVDVLRALRAGMGCALELEFAVDLGDADAVGRERPRSPTLYLLQIRPMPTHFLNQQIDPIAFSAEQLLGQTDRALGNGVYDDLYDVVYVKEEALGEVDTRTVARQVGEINRVLQREQRPFLLIGPGRWGSSDPALGIPVEWKQIAGARVIAETKMRGREVDPSQGTHFFQNITSLGVGYLTVSATGREPDAAGGFIDLAWLARQPACTETTAVRHVRFSAPLAAHLDGRNGTGTILKPSGR